MSFLLTVIYRLPFIVVICIVLLPFIDIQYYTLMIYLCSYYKDLQDHMSDCLVEKFWLLLDLNHVVS